MNQPDQSVISIPTWLERLLRRFSLDPELILGKLGQDVFWNVGSLGIAAAAAMLLNILITWFYDPQTLGVFNQVYAAYMIYSQVAAGAIHLSVMKHVAEKVDVPTESRQTAAAGLLLAGIFSSAAAVLFFAGRTLVGTFTDSPLVTVGLAWAAPGLVFFSLNKVLMAVLNGLRRMRTFALFQALRALLLIAALLGLTLIGWRGEALALIFPLAEIVLLVGLLWVCGRELEFRAWGHIWEWMKRHLVFGLKGMVGQVLGDVNYRIDIIMLGFFFDDHTVGIFSLASILAEGIYQLPAVLRTNFNPILVRLLSGQRVDELKELVRRGRRIAWLGMAVLGGVVVLLYPLGLYLVRNRADFLQSWPLFAVLMVGIVAASGYIPFSFLLLQAGKPGLQTVMIALLITVNVFLNLLLAPWLGVMGVAVATALSYGLSVLLLKIFVRRFLGLAI